MLTSDRWHEKDTTVLMTELKTDWCRVQKLLGRSRDKAGNLMPGWIVVQRRPTYVITRQLARWAQLSLLRVSGGAQRSIEGLLLLCVPPHPKPARHAATQTLRTAPSSQTRPKFSPVPAAPSRTATSAPLSHDDGAPPPFSSQSAERALEVAASEAAPLEHHR